MWVSDKTITKLAHVLQIEAYQLLIPENFTNREKDLLTLEEKVIMAVRKQFRGTLKI